MNNTDRKVRSSKRNFVIALMLLLLTNILMGVTLVTMSKRTLREQMDQRMLDIANTAAYQLDGDELKELKAEDKGTEEYERAMDTLRSFQDNIELDYIYGIRNEGNGNFTFTIDPAYDDPGEFGSPIVTTEALVAAANGTPSVDQESYTDEWGEFYSAYSPVFDSEGNVAGIVGVDFDAEWYDSKLSNNMAAAVIITMVALTIGVVLSFVILSQNRRRFAKMLETMEALDHEMQKLDDLIMHSSIQKLDMLPEGENSVLKTLASGVSHHSSHFDEYDEFDSSIESIYKKLKKYLRYVDAEAHTDPVTGVCNKAAYKARIKELDETVADGTANFSVAFFDVNGSKNIYTKYGYEAGEQMMFNCAKLLKSVFGKNNVYYIIGDEFVVLTEGRSRFEMEEFFDKFDEAIKKYNVGKSKEDQLSVAKGRATFNKEQHSDYRHVFIDAKADCDRDKDIYYGRA